MDEKNCPDAPANFKLCTKSQQMSLARKRRFQSLGLKYADSQEVRDRLTMIEKTRFIIWENFVRATISIPYSPWQIPCLSFSF